MRKRVSIVLIFIGITIMLYPFLGNIYNEYQKNKLIRDWENREPISQDLEGDRLSNFLSLEEVFTEEAENEKKQKGYQPKVIGTIEIDKINVNIPIIEGTTQEDLKWGAGYFLGTAQLGQQGNAALAGHRSYTFGEIFNRLDEVIKGDIIKINTKDGSYEYQVYEIKVVEPTDFSVLEPRGDEKTLTLITCEPIFVATHRLIIHARLI
ncbi:MAG: class D sortase [Alkaliphilus sp.]